jgi:AcrR family transcriptional regulator
MASVEAGDTVVRRARRRDGAATRLALLEAARALLGERGVDGVSTRDVATRAGVNQGLVYRYFGSKEELFAEAAGHGLSADGLQKMTDTPLAELPRILLDGALDQGARQPADVMPVLVGGVNDAAVRAVVRGRVVEAFDEILASRLTGPDTALRAELLASVLAGVTLMRQKLALPALEAADRDTIALYLDRIAAALLEDPTP